MHFHFQICGSPQRRAFFRHQNFKKRSKHLMFCAFSLPHLRLATAACNFSTSELQKVLQTPHELFATAACNFSTSELQKVLPDHQFFSTFSLPNARFATAACNFSTAELQKVFRRRQFFSIFTSKCVFRHSGVQFLISPLSTDLRTRRFNRPTFRLTRHTNHRKKHSISRLL